MGDSTRRDVDEFRRVGRCLAVWLGLCVLLGLATMLGLGVPLLAVVDWLGGH